MNKRALWTLIGTAAVLSPIMTSATPPATPAPHNNASTEARKATVRHYIDVWQNGRTDQLGFVIADGYSGHSASGDRDIAGLRQRIAEFRVAFPDMRFTIEDQIVQGDRVATRMTATGTSAKTGKRVRLVGLNISRFAGNRIIEEWPVWEAASVTP